VRDTQTQKVYILLKLGAVEPFIISIYYIIIILYYTLFFTSGLVQDSSDSVLPLLRGYSGCLVALLGHFFSLTFPQPAP